MIKHYSGNQVRYVIRYAHEYSHGRRFFEVIIYAKHIFDALRVQQRLFSFYLGFYIQTLFGLLKVLVFITIPISLFIRDGQGKQSSTRIRRLTSLKDCVVCLKLAKR